MLEYLWYGFGFCAILIFFVLYIKSCKEINDLRYDIYLLKILMNKEKEEDGNDKQNEIAD